MFQPLLPMEAIYCSLVIGRLSCTGLFSALEFNCGIHYKDSSRTGWPSAPQQAGLILFTKRRRIYRTSGDIYKTDWSVRSVRVGRTM